MASSRPREVDATDPSLYPAYCARLMVLFAGAALFSHFHPGIKWGRSHSPPVRVTQHDDARVDVWAVEPSPVAESPVVSEVIDLHKTVGGCMSPPAEWGRPNRVVLSEMVETDPPLAVYHDVLTARDPVCARLTHAKHAGRGGGGAHGEASDDDQVIWTTHLNRDRLERIEDLLPRWQGCVSLALWVCTAADWAYVAKRHAELPAMLAHVTVHAVLGHGAYPYNVMRNVALAPFAPWAAGKAAGMPAPWVLLADADGVPSVGAARFSEVLKDTVAGRATAPATISALPPALEWLGRDNALGLRAPALAAEGAAPPAAAPGVCEAWDGRPQPMQCEKSGRPSGLGWARRDSTRDWARERSRCPRPVDAAGNFFVIPSFDTHGRNKEILDALRAIPGDAPPAHAFAYLRALFNADAVEVQAQEGYPPSYVAMVPWAAWNSDTPAGAFPVHYSFIYEPYVIAKTPLASTSLDKWEPFDEFFREPGYDKCTFFVETAALPVGTPGHMGLVVLPQVFLMNVAGSGGPRPSRHINWQRFMDAAPERGLWCQDMCPCVPIANASVPPPQGFHSRRRRLSAAGGEAGAEGGGGDGGDGGGDAAADAFEAAAALDAAADAAADGAGAPRREPAAYARWRRARDAARAAVSAAAAAAAAAPPPPPPRAAPTSWPELEGADAGAAAAAVAAALPGARVELVPAASAVTADWREDRVRVFTEGGRVVGVPRVG